MPKLCEWTEEEKRQAVDMVARGESITLVAEVFGVSPHAIYDAGKALCKGGFAQLVLGGVCVHCRMPVQGKFCYGCEMRQEL